MIDKNYPYVVSVWMNGNKYPRLEPYWMEMAQCSTDWKAKEIAHALSRYYRLVRAVRIETEYIPYCWYPDQQTVEREVRESS